MQADRFAAAEPERSSIGPGTLILAAIGCFAIGFAALMAVPRFLPRYVQTPASTEPAPQPIEVGNNLPPPPPQPGIAVPGVVQPVAPNTVPAAQKIAAFGALAALSECKAAIRAGDSYEKVGPQQMAVMFGTRGKPLTAAQLDAGCRKLTE